MRIVLVVAGVIFLAPAASAHHSRAHYTGDLRELQGEVVRMRWGNPHTAVMLETVTEAGEAMTWRIDFLGTSGLSRETLQVGQRLTLAGLESAQGPGDLLATNVMLPDGKSCCWERSSLSGRTTWSRCRTIARGYPCGRPRQEPVLFRVLEPARRRLELGTFVSSTELLLPGERGGTGAYLVPGHLRRVAFGALHRRGDRRSRRLGSVRQLRNPCEPEGMPRLMMILIRSSSWTRASRNQAEVGTLRYRSHHPHGRHPCSRRCCSFITGVFRRSMERGNAGGRHDTSELAVA